MSADTAILINGEARDTIGAQDRGLQYGDGLFETLAVHRGQPLLWERHVQRLTRGAERLHLTPPDPARLRDEAMRLCAGVERAVLKIMLTRGNSARGYAPSPGAAGTRILLRSSFPDFPVAFVRDGVAVRLCATRLGRNDALAGIKHLNRLEQVLARAEWGSEYADGLMCDTEDFVIEGVSSNVFLVEKGVLVTPDLIHCGVEGVMRAAVIDAAKGISNNPCKIEPVPLERVYAAQELFLTNSLIGVWPVRRFQDKEYTLGPVTRAVQRAVRDAQCFDHD